MSSAADRTEIIEVIEVITRMAWLADRGDWDALVGVFADQVDLDYTSLTAGEPVTLAPTDIVARWRDGLGGLDATQHLVSNHLVELDGDRAVATAQFQATHVLVNPHGGRLWTLGGHYRFVLGRDGSGWRIEALTMTATWATGNQHIMTLAAQPAR